MLAVVSTDKVTRTQILLFKVLRKHGIFLEMGRDRNRQLEEHGSMLIMAHLTGKRYEDVKGSFPEIQPYKINLKSFENFIMEYLQTMRLNGTLFNDAARVESKVHDLELWLTENGVHIWPLVDKEFTAKICKRFLTDK